MDVPALLQRFTEQILRPISVGPVVLPEGEVLIIAGRPRQAPYIRRQSPARSKAWAAR